MPTALATVRAAPGLLLRPRLLEMLARRWSRRVVCVTGGPGFGKTVLLEHAVAQNRLARRGHDLLLGCSPADASPARFAASLADAAGVPLPRSEDPRVAMDAIGADLGRRWPLGVAVLLDDVHHLNAGGSYDLLLRLVDQAPSSVHFVLASRLPPRGLSRRRLRGDVEDISEDDLRLVDGELTEFARSNDCQSPVLGDLGGWPAMVALACRYGLQESSEFVWEAVLDELDDAGRTVLACAVAIGGGDAELLRAAAGDPLLDPASALAGVPLLAQHDDGTWVPHDLWSRVVDGVLDRARLAACQRRAADLLLARGDHDRAYRLYAQVPDWNGAALVLRDACSRGYAGPTRDVLEGWLELWPTERRDTAEGLLLRGVVRRTYDPFGAVTAKLLTAAVGAFQSTDNIAGEVAAATELAYVSRVRGDVEVLPGLMVRALELHEQGHREVDGPMALGRAVMAELQGDDERYVAELAAAPLEALSDEWRATVAQMLVNGYLTLGLEEPMLAAAHRCAGLGGSTYTGRHAVALAEWYGGRPQRALDTLHEIRADMGASRVDRFVLGSFAAMVLTTSGRLADADAALAVARAAGRGSTQPLMAGYVAGSEALVAAARGDDHAAAAALRAFFADVPLSGPIGRRASTRWLALAYVLLPDARPLLDGAGFGPLHQRTLAVARALAAAREGRRPCLDEVSLAAAITSMPLPWSLGLASAAAEAGDGRGRELAELVLDTYGEPARAVLRDLASDGCDSFVPGAKRLLGEIPMPPEAIVELRVLGPAMLLVGGADTSAPEWRRERVRALLLYLACNGRVRRELVAEALWPDLDQTAAGRNLRVTLTYANRVLEPNRGRGEAPFLLRQTGDELHLAAPDYLRVDVVEFERLLDEAEALEASGAVSRAEAALEQAVGLWRGPCLSDVAYEEWALDMVRRLERRFVAAAVRAAELALAGGRGQQACDYADRALRADEWCEGAHRVLVAVHLGRGDRLAAARALARCDEMLDSLGVRADETTEMLRRRLSSSSEAQQYRATVG